MTPIQYWQHTITIMIWTKFNYKIDFFFLKTNTKLVIALGYKIGYSQYLFIGGEFWEIHHWITYSSYILHTWKISKKLKINSYVINKLFKLQVFVI